NASGVGQRQIPGMAGMVLMDGQKSWDARSLSEYLSHHVAGAFGGNHGNVHVSRWNNLTEMDIKSMSEHQCFPRRQVFLDRLFKESALRLVRHQNHDHLPLG